MKNLPSINRSLFILMLCFNFFSYTKFETVSGDFWLKFGGKFKPEMFFGKNLSLLNSNNEGTKIWFARHTLDLDLDIVYGQESYGDKVAELYFDVRNKGIWGNPGSIASTTDAETKVLDAVGRRHRHSIPRHIFWIRSAWLEFQLNEVVGLPFDNQHWFTIGLFPYELGRGIALGDAYAVGPEILGFYTDYVVDQYAPGGLLHSEILPNKLAFDLYTAILQNRSASLSETNAPILAQEYGKRDQPQRGSGKINFLIAGRLLWDVFKDEKIGSLNIQPYTLYNRDPEQRVEFRGDALSQLGTIGMAAEYTHPRFEIAFDWAVNLGQQRVKGWDRNEIREENRNGQVVLVNSHIVDQSGNKVPFVRGSEAQQLIDCAPQDEAFNGKEIGTLPDGVGFVSGPVTMSNNNTRFRNPFSNKYEGWMFVIDAAYYLFERDLRLAVETGIASGDENPNNETLDGIYSGFIGLQEIYSGRKVKSAFLLGGAGKLTRPLSVPNTNQSPSRFAQVVNGFTNLVYFGVGTEYTPSQWPKKFSFNPNILAYWQEKPTRKFDAETNMQLDKLASTYLGIEVNLFMKYMILDDLKLFFVGSVFFPGQHYRDIKGKPLNAGQQSLLDRLDRTGFDQSRIPNIGDDPAYTFNLGLEFKF